jgi:hypothetical protein
MALIKYHIGLIYAYDQPPHISECYYPNSNNVIVNVYFPTVTAIESIIMGLGARLVAAYGHSPSVTFDPFVRSTLNYSLHAIDAALERILLNIGREISNTNPATNPTTNPVTDPTGSESVKGIYSVKNGNKNPITGKYDDFGIPPAIDAAVFQGYVGYSTCEYRSVSTPPANTRIPSPEAAKMAPVNNIAVNNIAVKNVSLSRSYSPSSEYTTSTSTLSSNAPPFTSTKATYELKKGVVNAPTVANTNVPTTNSNVNINRVGASTITYGTNTNTNTPTNTTAPTNSNVHTNTNTNTPTNPNTNTNTNTIASTNSPTNTTAPSHSTRVYIHARRRQNNTQLEHVESPPGLEIVNGK